MKRGFGCVVWGSLASMLYAGPTNLDRDVKASPAQQDDKGATAQSVVPVVRPEIAAARASVWPAAPAPGATEPTFQLTAATPPDAGVSLPKVTAPEPIPESMDECLLAQDCIDQYLYSLYERARKIDTVKVSERYKVTIKKKGKKRTVTKTRTKLVTEDFTWKDPNAAEKANMSMQQYVIGGMERSFKLKLYRLMRAADDAGHAPGITSGFRDDYRQSIASGQKAATDSSYHGGSRRGGYGYGLAADVVSTKGATRAGRWITTDLLWKWIDEHGAQYGIGRPYLDRDPPHIAPTDGKEYVVKRGMNGKRAGS